MADGELVFERAQWASLRASTPLELNDDDLAELRGINERLDLDEVAAVYLPLSRLLSLHAVATRDRDAVTDTFLGVLPVPRPYIIGLAGSVAVGKSTTARILQELLARWPAHPRVELVTTDGFLFANRELAARGLMERKGFPESYDTAALITFLAALKRGDEEVAAPVYSHVRYDIVDGAEQVVRRPDVLIVEGLNVLQTSRGVSRHVSDFFDFTIYVDADESDIEQWFVQRFFTLRATVFADPESFFHAYASMNEAEAESFARMVWSTINGVNLREEILPTRARARLVLEKAPDHRVRRVRLRR
ncbi:MAG TPA: type I pantothenate kinase [Acidimicrobiales bacterium]